MHRIGKVLIVLTILTIKFLITSCEAQATTTRPPSFEYNAMIGRGVNLGNALEAPVEGSWGVRIRDEYFKIIKERGFDSVRIPIRWSNHFEDDGPTYKIGEYFFERVEHVVRKSLENKLVTIINVHHFEEMYQDPDRYKPALIAIWRQIAERFKNYPDTLFFEIFNEPARAFTVEKWNEIYPEVLKVIRETNPKRIVIVDSAEWAHYSSVKRLRLVEDPYLIVSFHYYEPFHFTHQGAEWVTPSPPVGRRWLGTKDEVEEIRKHFREVADWALRNNVPIYVGEFGAYSKADMESRVRWTETVRKTAEEFGFSTGYWEFAAGFGIYDRFTNKWIEPLARAALGK